MNAQGFIANIIYIVHPLLVAVNAQLRLTYFTCLNCRELGTKYIVMNVRLAREENHISCRVDNSSDVNRHLGWVSFLILDVFILSRLILFM